MCMHGVCAYCASIYVCVPIVYVCACCVYAVCAYCICVCMVCVPIVYVCAWCGYTWCMRVWYVCTWCVCSWYACMVCVCLVYVCACAVCVHLVCVPRVHVCTHVCACACPCPSYVFLPFPSLCPCFPEVIPVPDKASFIPIAMFLHPSLLLANLSHATSRDTGYKIEVRLPSGWIQALLTHTHTHTHIADLLSKADQTISTCLSQYRTYPDLAKPILLSRCSQHVQPLIPSFQTFLSIVQPSLCFLETQHPLWATFLPPESCRRRGFAISSPRGTLLLKEGSRRPCMWHPGTSFPATEISSTPTWEMCGCLSFRIHFTTLISNPPPLFSLGFYDYHAHLEAPELTLCRSTACFWLADFPWKTGKTPLCGGENVWMWCELKRATSVDCEKFPTYVC